MKLGMPTLIELDSIEENIALCSELGLDFVEINMNLPYCLHLDSETLRKEIAISFSFHLPEDLDIAHLNPKIRETYLGIIKDKLVFMKEVNSKKLIMHMHKGIHISLPDQKIHLYDKYKSEYLTNILEFANWIEPLLEDAEIVLCIENTGDFHIGYTQEALKILLQKPHIKLTWDTGHDYKNNSTDGEFLKANLDKIRHIHLHDSTREKDHLELYTGELDIAYFKELAGRNDIDIVFETKTGQALRNSIDKWKNT